MKTKIKRHSRSVIAVVLTLCMLVSCMTVGLIATDAAKVTDSDTVAAKVTETEAVGANADSEMVGYNGGRVKGDWDSWTLHDATGNGFTVNLAADRTYKFVFIAGDNNDQFSSGTTISGTTNYNFSRNDTDAIKLKTTVAGNYTFKVIGYDGGGSSMTTRIEFPANTETTTWTAVGAYGTESDAVAGFFGTAWAPTATANDMTKSGTTWSKTWNNVTLDSAQTVYYKVAKNHSWDTAYPAQNAIKTLAPDTYNITITYNESTNAVDLTATSVAKSTLTVASNSDATVTATYNGTSATNGGTISNIPQGATVTVNVTPATSKMCSGVTYYYSGTTGNAAKTGTSWTFKMPAADTTVNAAITNVTLKKIYFNNSYTLYGSVYAYVYSKDSSNNHTYEYLGPRPGKTMTKLDNSNIWYIEVPGNVNYVEFISGDGKTTGEMSIPWKSGNTGYDYPKYTAPYGNNEHPTTTNGGTWGNYIYGSNNKRTNECTVSKGTTMNAANLFTGITATMYDYYTDSEVTNGWLNIADDEYSKGVNANGWKWNPYTTLNSALSAYANNSVQPKYNVTTPLYFGNLNTNNIGSPERAVIEAYHGWNLNANNSINLVPNSTAITGLSGKTLANDTIHYYKSDDANENGAPMAMFDEDFLSGENNANKALATILRTAAFPVRKTTEGATTTYLNKIYVEAKGFDPGSTGELWAHFYGGGTGDNKMTYDSASGYYSCDIPTGATEVIFVRQTISNPSQINWGSEWNESAGCAVPTSTTDANRLYVFKNYSGKCQHDKEQGHFNVNAIASSFGTTTGGHDYYEYDSTDGKDNAYITNLSNDKKTATIDYYADDAVWSGGTANNTKGFFPFDYDNKGNGAKDLGFGMKLTIPFTLNGNGTNNGVNTDGTDQEFRFSGDDDLWVFVDGKLVLDLGGAHARTEGSINFHTKTVTANSTLPIENNVSRNGSFADGFNTNENYVHTMTIYYMERGMFESNLKFGFSFHAIPNQFWIDKKIRTKDIINAGFYQSNGLNGAASNEDTTLTQKEGRFISKFEASYQNESFTVIHKVGDTEDGTFSPAANLAYTIDNDPDTHNTGAEGTYPIKHDLGNAFIGKFTKGKYFNLTETFGNNKYVYTPVFSVWDQANNNQAITPTGDNTSGYTFQFNPTVATSGGIENTNIKARFENYMDAHTLTLKKELTNAVDPNATFTLQVLFDFENDNNYIAYPLYCDLDGVRTKLSNTGTIDIKAGQILEIEEIPQKAKVQVTEVLDDTVSGYRYAGMTLKKGSTVLTKGTEYTEVTKGIQFQMGDGDMSAVISNKNPDNKYTIVYKYPSYGASPKTNSLYGEQSYTVTGVFTKSELESYMMLNNNGKLAFQNLNAEKTFINNKAPYEDNFMQNLSFANATLTGNGWDDNGDYYCEATTTSTADYTINAYFNLPYAVDDDLIPQESSNNSGKVLYTSNTTTCGEKDITCFDWYVTDGATNMQSVVTKGAPTFVNAPLILYTNVESEDNKKYFQYWSVKSQSAYGKQSTEYTRCYDYEFNFALFMDSIIEPIYADTWAQSTGNPHAPTNYKDYERYNPEIQIQGNDIGINIAFLENSRNQYNNGGNGTRPVNTEAADVIYSDFLLNFNYNATDGLAQLNKLDANTKMAGLVIEAVDYMDYEVDEGGEPTKNFDFDKNYSTDTKYTDSEDATAITNWLQGEANQPAHCVKSEFDVTKLDNKNCKQYYYSLNNRKSSDGQLLNTTQNRYKVFRAYAYIGDVVANQNNVLANVKLSDPVYFTIYDVGSQRLPDNATN